MSEYTILPPRADFEKNDFENLLYQKGREVIHEKALVCPCKSESTNHLSNCNNCGGSGWVFINPKQTRMLITNVSVTNDYKPWSEEARGTINVTSQVKDTVSFMDRITLIDGESIHNEVLTFNLIEGKLVSFSAYPIKHILVSCLFISSDEGLQDLPIELFTSGPRNKVQISTDILPADVSQIMVSIKYYFSPSYCIIEFKRETMQSYKYQEGFELNQSLPVASLARRTHYELRPVENVTIDNVLKENKISNKC